jgi:hypothetical protein
MLRRTFIGGLVVAAAAPALLANEAQAAGPWELLGSRRVNGGLDFDRIQVGIGRGSFDKIRLKVLGNALLIYDLEVRYGNNVVDDIPVRLLIPQGGQTRIIDLRGDDRRIRSVRFAYGKFINGLGPTYVELYGRHA